MKKIIMSACVAGLLFSCTENENREKGEENQRETVKIEEAEFEYTVDRFADVQILRYKINGWDNLNLQQKKLAYYLVQAGLAGRDIIYDQNYKHNIEIRTALEAIINDYEGDDSEDWENFMTYTKQVWFANGIHHHYSTDKFTPEFSQDYFEGLLEKAGVNIGEEALKAIFDPNFDNKRVNQNVSIGLIPGSANNFYGEGITDKMVDDFYNKIVDADPDRPVSHGLNSKLIINENGEVVEDTYKIGGLYGSALEQVAYWLDLATQVAENKAQADAIKILIQYYKTGDLELWDKYSIAWTKATDGDIDYINGFIEVYGDSKGYRGAYENIVQMKDFEATEIMGVLADNAQWFEDNSIIMNEHKKEEVKGISYNVVTVIGEAGDASPATPIGVNLPNAEWIREEFGSKSISLGNIIDAYGQATGGGILAEFAHDQEEIDRAKKYAALADNLHTALHEVVGHASGRLEPGVATPNQTLKSYASPLEEARADLVGLYYLMDNKLVELGLMESLEVGKAAYDNYIRNGMMTQLRRVTLGENIEQAHMRNRQLVASWAYEQGKKKNIIEKVVRDGKTYFKINDYEALREIFGTQLREIQRIKSQGDYEAGKNLIETYGVIVDQDIHAEVLKRSAPLDIPPYSGFVNPVLVPELDENGNITDIKIDYSKTFVQQMLEYSKEYSFLKP